MQDGIDESREYDQGELSREGSREAKSLGHYIGHEIVFDISGRYVIAGTLERFDSDNLYLSSADVRDLRDSSTTRERYVLEIGQFGIRPNRSNVVVPRPQVMSFSPISDIIL